MSQESTKQKILRCALKLFSRYGYEAVSVEQIAGAVGIKAPSLYKHYKSKQAIFDAIFNEMDRRYLAQTTSMQMHLDDAGADSALFSDISEEALVKKVQELFAYSLHDEYSSNFRKLLTIEQFRKKEFAELYTERYVNAMVCYHEKLFTQLIKCGVLENEDVGGMALQYVSPVLVLLSLCDRSPEKEGEAMVLLARHIRQFRHRYQKREN